MQEIDIRNINDFRLYTITDEVKEAQLHVMLSDDRADSLCTRLKTDLKRDLIKALAVLNKMDRNNALTCAEALYLDIGHAVSNFNHFTELWQRDCGYTETQLSDLRSKAIGVMHQLEKENRNGVIYYADRQILSTEVIA